VVFKARQVGLDRLVALKMILAGALAGPEERARFHREAEAVARLQHPHVVQIHEVGEHDGQPFFALEFLSGGSLDHQLAGTPWPAERATRLVQTLAGAVDAAHARGILHRDLKPANVLLAADGTPKITDFGLAKRLDTGGGASVDCRTDTGAIVGTPSYMAPEQATGLRGGVGPAADVYALGAILYECLTGGPPFRGATVWDTVEMVRSAEPVPPRRLQPKVPRDLETICCKCMEKNPRKRYPTALALAKDLDRFLAGEPIVARPMGTLGRLVEWARRRPAIAALSAAVALVTLAGAGLVAWGWYETEQARQGESRQRLQAVAAEGRAKAQAEAAERARRNEARQKAAAEQARRHAETQLYLSNIPLAQREWLAGNAGRALQLLNECPPDQRGWEWHYLKRQLNSSLLTLVGPSTSLTAVAYSPDGKLLATAGSADRAVFVWDADAGTLLHQLPHGAAVTGLTFTPDGSRILSASLNGAVRFWDAATGAPGRSFRSQAGVTAVALSTDGKRLALGGPDKVVRLWDADSGKELRTFEGHAGPILSVAISPDGARLASVARFAAAQATSRTVRLWDAATGKEAVEVQGRAGMDRAVAFSPDGRHLAATGLDHLVRICATQTGRLMEGGTLSGHRHVVKAVAYSRDGKLLATAGYDQLVKVWDAQTHRELFTLVGHLAQVYSVAFRPDGLRLASADVRGVVQVWDATGGQDALTAVFPDGDRLCSGVAFRADGEQVATLCGGAIRLWDVANRRPVPAPRPGWGPGAKPAAGALALSPDGRYAAAADRGGTIRLWLAATGEELFARDGAGGKKADPTTPYHAALAFSADSRRLAWADTRGLARVWEAPSGRELNRLEGAPAVRVALAPDAQRLAWGDADGNITVWDTGTGRRVRMLAGPVLPVLALALDAAGRYLASEDEQMRVWDLATGRQVHAFTARTQRGGP
jgi:WD40 repeat protein